MIGHAAVSHRATKVFSERGPVESTSSECDRSLRQRRELPNVRRGVGTKEFFLILGGDSKIIDGGKS
jgi:hypothetical protein